MSLEIKIEQLFIELVKWPGYSAIHALVERGDIELYLAGGAIRNLIIGERKIKDYDFFVKSDNKKDVLDYLTKYGKVILGPFGSPRWYPDGAAEIYCDLIWINEFYNGLWHCKDIVDVLNQFDFTANAVAVDIKTAQVFNPENGLRDIDNRIIRAVRFDYPNEPISDSTSLKRLEVLWFRLLHYANTYDMKIEPITKSWIESNLIFKRTFDNNHLHCIYLFYIFKFT